jgi:hypothetical protein
MKWRKFFHTSLKGFEFSIHPWVLLLPVLVKLKRLLYLMLGSHCHIMHVNFFLGQKSEVVAIQSLQHPLLALGGFFYFCSIGSTSPSQRKKT